jgi:indolepyruvate ferredoxin oxidoreductase alpha subunit
MPGAEVLLGNGAIARGLLEAGAEVVTAYPGTPSTEVMEEVLRQGRVLGAPVTADWSVNEKVAFDIALAAAMCGKRAATVMKQVGLNVASDSLLSAAYTGVVGGFVVVACDDPGPHSSQTEQDTRLFSLFAKVPVLDPASPREARDMARFAFELSERHRIPVILRPTTRICHARQPIAPADADATARRARFVKEPTRWAATPRFRVLLHRELNAKLDRIRAESEQSPFNREEPGEGRLGILAAGHAWATARDVLREEGKRIPLLKIGTAFPLPLGLVRRFVDAHDRVIVLEEPDAAIETQIPDRTKVQGRLTGTVPPQGELTPEVIAQVLGFAPAPEPAPPGPPPELCVGCGHRAAFLAVHRALPRAIFSGDIGCYTLGVNQETLDTCLDMGASITLAIGFERAHRRDKQDVPIVAFIGDSTFFHAGMPPLLEAVTSGARIVVVVLDNGTVAMTGAQPTLATGGAEIERIAKGLGVRFVETIDPYDVDDMVALVRKAHAFTKEPGGGVAVVIARRACALEVPPREGIAVEVDAATCNRCDHCLRFFGCPALVEDPGTGKVTVDHAYCVECGVCVDACPPHAIHEVPRGEAR